MSYEIYPLLDDYKKKGLHEHVLCGRCDLWLCSSSFLMLLILAHYC